MAVLTISSCLICLRTDSGVPHACVCVSLCTQLDLFFAWRSIYVNKVMNVWSNLLVLLHGGSTESTHTHNVRKIYPFVCIKLIY